MNFNLKTIIIIIKLKNFMDSDTFNFIVVKQTIIIKESIIVIIIIAFIKFIIIKIINFISFDYYFAVIKHSH
jgi:hypothetical protein